MRLSGGEALVKSLVRQGVEVVFGLPGIHINGITAALRDEPDIRVITTRHEQACTYMAYGYACATGKPGVALVTPGAGVYNAAAGLATAYSRSVPVLQIAGQIPRGHIGKNLGSYHEVDNQLDIVGSVTKWRQQVLTPGAIPEAVSEAFHQMRTGRPRPVCIEIPPDALVETDDIELEDPAFPPRTVPSADQLKEAAAAISQSRLPLIVAGGGVALSGAEQALVELVDATNIPVVTSGGGKSALPDRHPLCYGSCISPEAERHELNQLLDVMKSADLVIGIGTRFSLGNPAGEASTLVNINIDEFDLNRIQANTIALHGDAKATIEALLPLLVAAGCGDRPSPAEAVAAARRLVAYYDIRLHEPQYPILEAVQKGTPEDAFAVWDVSQFGFYSRTHWQVNHPNTYIDSGYSFNLGFAFPTALGVKVAQPDRSVMCMAGDGSFMFNAAELSTAVKYGINAVTVIFRDDAYGSVARDLDELFDGTYQTDLVNPDFVKFAESFGAVGLRADNPMDLETLIPSALERSAPVIIDAPIGHIALTRPRQIGHVPKLPWTHPEAD